MRFVLQLFSAFDILTVKDVLSSLYYIQQGAFMRNLIIAISAICLLQLTFQAYMAVDRSNAEYTAMSKSYPVSGLPTGADVVADLPEINDAGVPSVFVANHTRIRILRRRPLYRSPAPLVAVNRMKAGGRQ